MSHSSNHEIIPLAKAAKGGELANFREPAPSSAPKVIEPEPGSWSRSSKITAPSRFATPRGSDSPPLPLA